MTRASDSKADKNSDEVIDSNDAMSINLRLKHGRTVCENENSLALN